MKAAITILAAAASLACAALNLQISVTGLKRDRSRGSFTNINGSVVHVPYDEWTNSTLTLHCSGGTNTWEDTGPCYYKFTPDGISLSTTASTGFTAPFEVEQVRNLGTFGYVNSLIPGQDDRWFNAVFTARGDPYSIVQNWTDTDRTVNGVVIKSGEGQPLLTPMVLSMQEIANVVFTDIESGEAITPANGGYDEYSGTYTLNWAGNIRFADGTYHPTISNDNPIVFADILPSADGEVIYGTNGAPVYAGTVRISTNIYLNTWWDFVQDEWGGSPKAKINDEVVCGRHSTGHIISYRVNLGDVIASQYSGKARVYFTMSQTPESGKSGGSCTMKCWDSKFGSDENGYNSAPSNHKASQSAGLGVARFVITINIMTGEWKVEPAQ